MHARSRCRPLGGLPGPVRLAGLLSVMLAGGAVPARAQCAGFSGDVKLVASDAAAADRFGQSVGASGGTLVIGAHRDADLGTFAGSAWVRTFDGAVWVEEAKLLAPDGEAFDNFGTAVAIDGDTVIVGVPRDDERDLDAGAAQVFVRSGGLWSHEAKLMAADAQPSAELGVAVAIDGDTAVVGAHYDLVGGQNRGSAYVFVREAGAWREQGKLTTLAIAASASFGLSVAVSGDRAIVGAPDDNDASFSSGSAHVFVRSGEVWSLETELRAADEFIGDEFGRAVALEGDRALIGAPGQDDNGDNAGAIYVFERVAGTWQELDKLRATDGEVGDQLGGAVALSGAFALGGARGDDDAGNNSGASYVFEWSPGAWSQRVKLVAADAEALDQFGHSVGLDGGLAVVGASDDDDAGSGSGSARVFCLVAAEGDCSDGLDGDGDGLIDCADSDCLPPAARGLELEGAAPTVLSWSPATGPFDVASDLLSALVAARQAEGPCVARDLVAPTWSDTRPLRADGYYYLVRATGACLDPDGGWGFDSLGSPRPACP